MHSKYWIWMKYLVFNPLTHWKPVFCDFILVLQLYLIYYWIILNLTAVYYRMEDISHENSDLRSKCDKYERSNQSLMSQLTKLQNIIKKFAPQQSAGQTGICLMVSVTGLSRCECCDWKLGFIIEILGCVLYSSAATCKIYSSDIC